MPLVFVPTPLGNLRDITLRALDVLRDCTLLVAEDSRVAKKLLNALALPGKEIRSYREQNARAATRPILERAREELVAVVTDAGMPGISDPGAELVASAREAGVAVEVLPGPNAAIAAAVLSGFPIGRFIFEGFPPRSSSARRASLKRALELGIPSIWYESPNRIRATLHNLASVDPSARVFLLREYTKRFEEQLHGDAAQIEAKLGDRVRGEISFVVMPSPPAPARPPLAHELDAAIDALLETSHSVASVAKTLAARGFGERSAIYARAGKRKRSRRE
jgi:16S rRNA (cytidine1402-2'-O)-methyltransferase